MPFRWCEAGEWIQSLVRIEPDGGGWLDPHAIIAPEPGRRLGVKVAMSLPRLLTMTFLGLVLTFPVQAADDAVTLNFVNADIDAVVKAVAEMTGRNFVVDPRVKGVINIVSARPVPR